MGESRKLGGVKSEKVRTRKVKMKRRKLKMRRGGVEEFVGVGGDDQRSIGGSASLSSLQSCQVRRPVMTWCI